jgi:ABC-type spermidine/putrescine transport system permease subunit I
MCAHLYIYNVYKLSFYIGFLSIIASYLIGQAAALGLVDSIAKKRQKFVICIASPLLLIYLIYSILALKIIHEREIKIREMTSLAEVDYQAISDIITKNHIPYSKLYLISIALYGFAFLYIWLNKLRK